MGGEGLVHQEELRGDGQSAGDADALLHAAGQLGGFAQGGVAEAHQFQHAAGVAFHLAAAPAAVAGADAKATLPRALSQGSRAWD